jgi:magnesium transporter
MSMVVNCAAYRAGRRFADVDLSQASAAKVVEGDFVWIGLQEPDEDLLRTVQRRFGLHDLAVEDAHSAHQRPKLEVYGDSIFIVLRTAQLQEGKIHCGETHIFAGRGYVVTVRHGSTTGYGDVRARCEGRPNMLAMGESFVVYSVMDFVVDNFFPVLHELEAQLDRLEEDIFSNETPHVQRVYDLRHELLTVRRAVQPLQEVCSRMMRFDAPLIEPGMHAYFRDVQDHVIRVVEGIDNLIDLVKAAMEANLQLTSLRQNNIIKIFSVAAVVLMPPTLVASIYGMNFKHMPELEWQIGYPVALGLMLLVAVLPYVLFKWMRWL